VEAGHHPGSWGHGQAEGDQADLDGGAFAKEIKAEQVYAVYASFNELGGRAYWLLLTKSVAKKAAKAIRVKDAATIRKGQYYVDAQ
jgi:hypothetical protein